MTFFTYFISKYDTQYWDNDTEVYEQDEWKSIYDIDKNINGVILTPEEYMEVEKRYSSVIKYLCEKNNVHTLIIATLEKYDNNCEVNALYTIEMLNLHQTLYEGQQFDKENIDNLIPLLLRDDAYCFLYSPDNHFIVSFTSDMYMYITCAQLSSDDIKAINNIGLFIMQDKKSMIT